MAATMPAGTEARPSTLPPAKAKTLPPANPRRKELHDMSKDQLVKLVLELEGKADELEKDNDVLREMNTLDERAQVFHERAVEMGFAEGPFHVQSSDYTQRLLRACRRAP